MKHMKVTRVIYLSSEWSMKPSEDWAMTVDARGLMTPAACKNNNICRQELLLIIMHTADVLGIFSLRIKHLCASSFRNSEEKQKRKYEIFLYFCFVFFFFFFFSYCQFLKSFLRGRLVFGKKKPRQIKQSTLSSRHFLCFVVVVLHEEF